MTRVLLNGELVESSEARVSVLDRGFVYGDGLFETMRVANGRLFRWDEHWQRLSEGLKGCRISVRWDSAGLFAQANELLRVNQVQEGVLRLQVSRGVGQRGYSPQGAGPATVVMTTFPLPSTMNRMMCWRLATVSLRLPAPNVLSGWKTTNKLLQVMARAEAEELGADEALLLDHQGFPAESSSGNLFWVKEGQVMTPSLGSGVLPGTTRMRIRELCDRLGVGFREGTISARALRGVEGVFLSLTSYGVVEVVELDHEVLGRSVVVERLWGQYQQLVKEETGCCASASR